MSKLNMGYGAYHGRNQIKSVLRVFAIALTLNTICAVHGQDSPRKQDLQIKKLNSSLRITVSQETSRPHFNVELHNAGNQPLILNLGTMLGNGKILYADGIHLLLKEPGGKVLQLEITEGGMMEGRIDPMVVPLPVGATFVLPIDLKDYNAPKEKIWSLHLPPGKYMLRADFTGVGVPQRAANPDMQGIALMPYWIGNVASNILPFTLNREIGSERR